MLADGSKPRIGKSEDPSMLFEERFLLKERFLMGKARQERDKKPR
jgi:hypothetical protein